MPSAWLIGPLVIKSELVILLASFIVGFILFRLISSYSTIVTKQQMDEVVNVLIVFVIALWIGKIATNFSTFITDPISILAYPSDSVAFYIASILSVIYVQIKTKRAYHQVIALLYSFLVVFFTASFTYEFIQMIVGTAAYTLPYLGLLVLLLILFVLKQDKLAEDKLVFIGLVTWSLGQWILSIFSEASVFQFHLSHWFYGSISLAVILLCIYRKKVKK